MSTLQFLHHCNLYTCYQSNIVQFYVKCILVCMYHLGRTYLLGLHGYVHASQSAVAHLVKRSRMNLTFSKYNRIHYAKVTGDIDQSPISRFDLPNALR